LKTKLRTASGDLPTVPHSYFGTVASELLQFGEFGLGFVEDRDVWVGVFPDIQELHIVLLCLLGIAQLFVDLSQFIMRQYPLLQSLLKKPGLSDNPLILFCCVLQFA
jgi:hypothetical protein